MGWWKFLTKTRLLDKVPGRQFTRSYNIRKANDDQILLMRSNRARSPEEASRLMERSGMRAYEYLQQNPVIKEPLLSRMKRRLIRELQRIETGGRRVRHIPKKKESRVPIIYERQK